MESAALNSLPRQRIEANAWARCADGRGADCPAGNEASHQAAALRTPGIALRLTSARGYAARGGGGSRGRDGWGGPADIVPLNSPPDEKFYGTVLGNSGNAREKRSLGGIIPIFSQKVSVALQVGPNEPPRDAR